MPSILAVAREFSRRLLLRERESASAMLRAWAVAFERLDLELRALTERMEQALRSGETVTESWLWRRGHLEQLLIQAGREAGFFAQFAELSTITDKAYAVQLALESSRTFLQLPRRTQQPTINLAFNRAPSEALEQLVGTFSSGSPLSRIFATFGPQQSVLIQDALIKGVATGKNPRVIAREVRDVAHMPANRALTISRTEPLRAYRSASLANYRANSDAVEGWVRIEKLDMRTCPSCWALHGREWALNDPFPAHPNCRGTCAPRVIGLPHNIPSGAQKFAELSEAEQLEVLGPAKFEAYRSGRISLDDLVAIEDSPHWGPTTRERSLDEALGQSRKAA